MESISKRTGKRFTGKFAETAARIGIADPVGEQPENPVKKTVKKHTRKRKK